ncbi:MAG: hypothetical protein PVH29_13285 [Candidatus Zixiibacteriota bacterium]
MIKIMLRYCGCAILFIAAFLLVSCEDEEVRELYGGPWRIVKTPPELEAPIKDMFFLDAVNGWATSYKYLLRWNGKEWFVQKKFVHANPDADYSLKPVWVFARDDIWVAGGESLPGNIGHSKIWHYNGEYWEDVDHPDVGGIGQLWFNSRDDGWAMGGYYMLRWDGTEWYKTEWECSATTDTWFNYPNDGWRTTPSYIYHWDGAVWTRVAECEQGDGFGSIAFNRPDSGWAGLYEARYGDPPLMFHYDGREWDYFDDIFNYDVWDIDFSGPNYGCAAGIGAAIYENGEWHKANAPRTYFWCVECVGPNDIWAGSDAGDIYHFTGF